MLLTITTIYCVGFGSVFTSLWMYSPDKGFKRFLGAFLGGLFWPVYGLYIIVEEFVK